MVIDDLNEMRNRNAPRGKIHHPLLHAAGCVSSNSGAVKQALEKAVQDAGLQELVEVRGVGCMNFAARARSCRWTRTARCTKKSLPRMPASLVGTVKGGKTEVQSGDPQSPFFTEQFSIVLANSGIVDPERIESYIAAEGYQALHNVLREMMPKEVVDEVVKSGLRGRGGAGYPTGLKWATVAKTENLQKYIICNATRATPARSWIAACSKAIRTVFLKAWPLPPTPWAPTRVSFTCAPNIRWPSAACKPPSNRRNSAACSAAAFLNRHLISTSNCASAPARLFAARKPR